jgi:hypothetical protein
VGYQSLSDHIELKDRHKKQRHSGDWKMEAIAPVPEIHWEDLEKELRNFVENV